MLSPQTSLYSVIGAPAGREPDISKNTSRVVFTPDVGDTVRTAVGCEAVAPTVTFCVALAKAPASSVAFSVTVYVPGASYAFDTVTPFPVEPFPKSQSYDTSVRPDAGLELLALKKIVVLMPGFDGDIVKLTVGGSPGATVMVCVEMAWAPIASVTVKVTVNVPIVR